MSWLPDWVLGRSYWQPSDDKKELQPLNNLTVMKGLLLALSEANKSERNKAVTFKASYEKISEHVQNDRSLERIAALANNLTKKWNQNDVKTLTTLAEEQEQKFEKAAAERKRAEPPRTEESPRSQKRHKPEEEMGSLQLLQLPSKMKTGTATVLKGISYISGAAGAGLVLIRGVKAVGHLMQGNPLGAIQDVVDPNFLSNVARCAALAGGTGTVSGFIRPEEPPEEPQVVRDLGKDLTEEARKGLLNPAIGRKDEIRETISILTGDKKPNAVITGPSGVGKTAIVEGLAYKIATGDVPDKLKGMKILSVNMGKVVEKTNVRGSLEEKMERKILPIALQPNVILFIDEIHVIKGAGRAEGNPSVSDLLKTYLDRGQIRCIGATTDNEYKIIEEDPALARRFKKVGIRELGIEDAVAVLRQIKDGLEKQFRVPILEEAIKEAVHLSAKYIKDRFLPDKAIDLITAITSKISLEIEFGPKELETMKSELENLQAKLSNLQKEPTLAHKGEIEALKQKIAAKEIDLHYQSRLYQQDLQHIKNIQAMHAQFVAMTPQDPARMALIKQIENEKKQLKILRCEVNAAAVQEEIKRKLNISRE